MGGHDGSNALAGDTHDGGNKAMRVEGRRAEKTHQIKNIQGRSDIQTKKTMLLKKQTKKGGVIFFLSASVIHAVESV